jgi:hypothetical protein
MASFIYNSFWADLGAGNIDLDTNTFKVMLVTSSYTADKDAHDRRNDVTNEVSGTAYTAGGATCTITIATNTSLDRTTYTFTSVNWPTSTITARGAVVYKSRGGASSADELIFYNDFGSNISTSAATFTVAQSVITVQN